MSVSLDAGKRVVRRAYLDVADEALHKAAHGCNVPELSLSISPLLYLLVMKAVALWQALQHLKQVTTAEPFVTVTDVTDIEESVSKPTDVVVDIVVTLDDLYHARTKKLVLRVKSARESSGMLLRKFLIPLANHETTYTFIGQGDETAATDQTFISGDVVVKIAVAPHITGTQADVLVNRFDLHVSVKTTVYDFIRGRTILIPDMPGGDVQLHYGGKDKTPVAHTVIAGRGLPFVSNNVRCRGSLYVFFQLQLPKRPAQDLLAANEVFCHALLKSLSGYNESGTRCDSDSDSDGATVSWTDASRGLFAASRDIILQG